MFIPEVFNLKPSSTGREKTEAQQWLQESDLWEGAGYELLQHSL